MDYALHESGSVQRISLVQKPVEMPVGALPAELLLFHENGALRRLFPQDGALDGFWDEAQEYALAPVLEISTPVGPLRARFIAVAFYPSGELFALTLWPWEVVSVKTPVGVLAVRTGISFHRSGAVQSLEPNAPTLVDTPIGKVTAYDPDPLGVSGDRNSLAFNEDGGLACVMTSAESRLPPRDGRCRSFCSGQSAGKLRRRARVDLPRAPHVRKRAGSFAQGVRSERVCARSRAGRAPRIAAPLGVALESPSPRVCRGRDLEREPP